MQIAHCAVKPDMQNSVISIVTWKGMLPDLSFSFRWSATLSPPTFAKSAYLIYPKILTTCWNKQKSFLCKWVAHSTSPILQRNRTSKTCLSISTEWANVWRGTPRAFRKTGESRRTNSCTWKTSTVKSVLIVKHIAMGWLQLVVEF